MTDTLLQFAEKLRHFERELAEAQDRAVSKTALEVKKRILAGAPSRLRGVGKSGAKLSINYQVKHAQADGHAYAILRAVGPWQLIERDTDPHIITPKRATGVGRSRRKRQVAVITALSVGSSSVGGFGRSALKVAGYGYGRRKSGTTGFFSYAKHPGTKGKHPWAKGVDAVMPIAPTVYQNETQKALLTIFG